ncbi:MAG: coenzyme-B sulfoethylthiotransferase subunit gamma [Methanoregula sp.]
MDIDNKTPRNISALVNRLDSPSVGEKTAALDQFGQLFRDGQFWHSLDKDSQDQIRDHFLDLLDQSPVEDDLGVLSIGNFDFSHIIRVSTLVPDDRILDRLHILVKSDDPKVSFATIGAMDKASGYSVKKDIATPGIHESHVSGHNLRLDNNGMMFEMLQRHVPNESASVHAMDGNVAMDVSGNENTASRYVNTGFVLENDPDHPIAVSTPLKPASGYYFIVNVGEIEGWSGDENPTELVHLDNDAVLQIAISSIDEGISLKPGFDTGTIGIRPEGAYVVSQPGSQTNDTLKAKHFSDWLFFPVTTSLKKGQYHMRCMVYTKQILLQSRCVTVHVQNAWPQGARAAWSSKVDFTISDTLFADVFNQLQEHRASFFFDIATQGDSRVYVFSPDGKGSFINQNIVLEEAELKKLIACAREKLKDAAFLMVPGKATEYKFLNGGQQDLNSLVEGLILLATWGFNVYDKIHKDIQLKKSLDFSEILQDTSYIQVVMKENPQNFFPIGMIYDFNLKTQQDTSRYHLCPQFLKALQDKKSLKELRCFVNNCTAKTDPDGLTVCPMGFWGFRHIIGSPLSVAGDSIRNSIQSGDELKILFARAQPLDSGDAHLKAVRNIVTIDQNRFKKASVDLAKDEKDLLVKLNQPPHIIYFFCHGTDTTHGDVPLLIFDENNKKFTIDPTFFLGIDIPSWEKRRPLIFLNGCHTGDIGPGKYLDFIKPLIVTYKASGVIGTEINIHPVMASIFAQKCLSSFIGGASIGEAVRDARLAVLSTYNPLGLVYDPFISGGLKLEKV